MRKIFGHYDYHDNGSVPKDAHEAFIDDTTSGYINIDGRTVASLHPVPTDEHVAFPELDASDGVTTYDGYSSPLRSAGRVRAYQGDGSDSGYQSHAISETPGRAEKFRLPKKFGAYLMIGIAFGLWQIHEGEAMRDVKTQASQEITDDGFDLVVIGDDFYENFNVPPDSGHSQTLRYDATLRLGSCTIEAHVISVTDVPYDSPSDIRDVTDNMYYVTEAPTSWTEGPMTIVSPLSRVYSNDAVDGVDDIRSMSRYDVCF